MPEDLIDKLIDFDLMLKGFVSNDKDTSGNTPEACDRIMSWWYWIYADIEKIAEQLPAPNAEETTAEEPEKPRRGRKHEETAK